MPESGHPHSPSGPLFRVRHGFRGGVGQRFGVMYANACLSRREDEDGRALYAPIAIFPGDVPVFSWPAVEMRTEWLEQIQEPDNGMGNVLPLRRSPDDEPGTTKGLTI